MTCTIYADGGTRVGSFLLFEELGFHLSFNCCLAQPAAENGVLSRNLILLSPIGSVNADMYVYCAVGSTISLAVLMLVR